MSTKKACKRPISLRSSRSRSPPWESIPHRPGNWKWMLRGAGPGRSSQHHHNSQYVEATHLSTGDTWRGISPRGHHAAREEWSTDAFYSVNGLGNHCTGSEVTCRRHTVHSPLVWNVQNGHIHSNGKRVSGWKGLEYGHLMGMAFLYGTMKLRLHSVHGCTNLIHWILLHCMLSRRNFKACEFTSIRNIQKILRGYCKILRIQNLYDI